MLRRRKARPPTPRPQWHPQWRIRPNRPGGYDQRLARAQLRWRAG